MEAKASARYIRVTPMKARRVVNLIRGQQANEALAILKFAPQAASEPVFKVLESAVANARQKACLLYTSPSPRDLSTSRMPSSA